MFEQTTTVDNSKELVNEFPRRAQTILPGKLFGLTNGKLRSFLKAISYRFLGSLATIAISFALTQEVNLSLSIGALDLIGKIGLYYLHERIWDKIS